MITEALEQYDSGAARADILREGLYRGTKPTTLADEIARMLELGRALTPRERGFFDYVEEWLTD